MGAPGVKQDAEADVVTLKALLDNHDIVGGVFLRLTWNKPRYIECL